MRRLARNLHFIVSALLLILIVPAFRWMRLPLRFTWREYVMAYWVFFPILSWIFAGVIFLACYPREVVRWIRRPGKPSPPAAQLRTVRNVLLPSAYLFVGLVLVFAYNDVIAAWRFTGSADKFLAAVDSRVFGVSVSSLAHQAATWLPSFSFRAADFLYFCFFLQIGAMLLIVPLKCGLPRAFQFVGTLLTAYYLALIIFFFIPATGPYFVCLDHFSILHNRSGINPTQFQQVELLRLFASGGRPKVIGLDYFIGLPCLHIAQPIVILWFLRPWKRVMWVIAAVDLAMVPAILFLEQHYVVDLVAGVVVAILAVMIAGQKENGAVSRSAPL